MDFGAMQFPKDYLPYLLVFSGNFMKADLLLRRIQQQLKMPNFIESPYFYYRQYAYAKRSEYVSRTWEKSHLSLTLISINSFQLLVRQLMIVRFVRTTTRVFQGNPTKKGRKIYMRFYGAGLIVPILTVSLVYRFIYLWYSSLHCPPFILRILERRPNNKQQSSSKSIIKSNNRCVINGT